MIVYKCIRILPFCSSQDDFHSNFPSKRTAWPYITMKPLFEVSAVHIFIHEHPTIQGNKQLYGNKQ